MARFNACYSPVSLLWIEKKNYKIISIGSLCEATGEVNVVDDMPVERVVGSLLTYRQ